jgi:anti-sigma factor RsiW
MNCGEWEERLALYAGGDLVPAEKAEVERHLQDCTGCQVFLSGLSEGLQVLRDAHAQEVAPAHFAAVRARVLAELGRGRRRWWLQRWAFGLATAALLLLVVLWMWPARRSAPQPQVVRVSPAPEVPVTAPKGPAPAPVPHVSRRARTPRPARPKPVVEPAKPLVVKLVTDDPDVVIYWLTETRGD